MLAAEAGTERKVTVTRHAALAYRGRRADRRSLPELEAEIAGLVRCGVEQGNLFDRKPDGFVLYGKKSKRLPHGQRFVCCDSEPRVGFVVKRFPYEDVVVTTLIRVGVRR